MQPGHTVATPYGFATLVNTRDNIHELRLPFGRLYVHRSSIEGFDASSLTDPEQIRMNKTMELNEAYEALESCRRANLELKCRECGITKFDHYECTMCLMERGAVDHDKQLFSLINKFVKESKSKPNRCLTCGSPTCVKHSSSTFWSEGITVCQHCEKVFHMDFMIDCLTMDSNEKLKEKIYHLLDLYDRVVLLLKYSTQYIDDIAEALNTTERRRNHLSVSSSSAGMISGVLGMAAALTILTPAGPPLLISSLLFGGAAATVQTSSDVHNKYFFEPNKLADRILALHAMLVSVINVSGALRTAAIIDFTRKDPFNSVKSPMLKQLQEVHIENRRELLVDIMDVSKEATINTRHLERLAASQRKHKKKNAETVNTTIARKDSFGSTNSTIVRRHTAQLSRVGAGVLQSAQFVPVVGGALSAASFLVEVKSIATTLTSMQKGSTSARALAIQRIRIVVEHDLPATSKLEAECKAFLEYMKQRIGSTMTQTEAALLLLRQTKKEEKDNGDDASMTSDDTNIFLDELANGNYSFRFNEDGTVAISASGRSSSSAWVLRSESYDSEKNVVINENQGPQRQKDFRREATC